MSTTLRLLVMAVAWAPGALGQSEPQLTTPHERPPVHPWMPRPAVAPAGVIQHCGPWVRDGYRSIQVNVDARGCNVVGDAANEPSIAVSATDPRRIVIGWRQFNSVASDFREPGWAYSHDGGHTWVFRGSLDPGVFGSDPVLASGPDGEVYYLTIGGAQPGETRLFRSNDSGLTWALPTQAVPYFYDKPWFTIDTTEGVGRGNIYVTRPGGGVFRSTDAGRTFEYVSGFPYSGETIAVDEMGTVYLATSNSGDVHVYFTASGALKDPNQQAVADVTNYLTLGFYQAYPNTGGGLPGQAWVATGRRNGVNPPSVYVLHVVGTAPAGRLADPCDVLFVRSPDGGTTWSRAVVVNDDGLAPTSAQWFNMMSVAPNGRIDVAWNDTRNSGVLTVSELYYTYSSDGGETFAPNVPVSLPFDTTVGFPYNNPKLGDYYHMVSDNLGVNVAYAATFNGEQDIYFLRIGPWDCNGNEIDDALDISEARSRDCNANGVPDECEYRCDLDGDGLTTLSDFAAFQRALTGPGGTLTGGCTELLDPDHDGDMDLHDFYTLQSVFAP
jgi:hypothetical protein